MGPGGSVEGAFNYNTQLAEDMWSGAYAGSGPYYGSYGGERGGSGGFGAAFGQGRGGGGGGGQQFGQGGGGAPDWRGMNFNERDAFMQGEFGGPRPNAGLAGTFEGMRDQYGGGQLGRPPANLEELAYEIWARGEDVAGRSQADFAAGTGELTGGREALLTDPRFQQYGGLVSALQQSPDILSAADIDARVSSIADRSAEETMGLREQLSSAVGAAGGAGGGGALVGAIAGAEKGHQDRVATARREMDIQSKELNRQGLMQAIGAGQQFSQTQAGIRSPYDFGLSDAYLGRRYAQPDLGGYASLLASMGQGGGGFGGGGGQGLFGGPEMGQRNADMLRARATNMFPLGWGSEVTGGGGSFGRSMGAQLRAGSTNPTVDKFGIQGGGPFGGFSGTPRAQTRDRPGSGSRARIRRLDEMSL